MTTLHVRTQLDRAGLTPYLRTMVCHEGPGRVYVTGFASKEILPVLLRHPKFLTGPFDLLHDECGPPEDCADYRSIRGSLGWGSLQVIVNTKDYRYSADIDEASPYDDVVGAVWHSGAVLFKRIRRWFRRAAVVLLLLLLPALASAQDRRALHWGLACSIGADIADVASTAVAFHQRPDVVEGNFLFGTRRDLGRILIIKGIGAVAVNGIAVWLHDDYPTPSLWLVFGNCVLKSAVTANNLRIAFRVRW